MAFTPNYLSQQDPQWKNVKLGFGNVTLGTDGCAVTALTMLVNGYSYNETPKTLNQKLKDLGSGNGFIGPLVVWGALPLAFPRLTYRNLILSRDHDAPIAEIDAAIARGQPVVVETDRSLASGLQNHWVVLYAKQGDDYLMLDPWPYPPDNKDTLLTVRYGFGRPAKKVITATVFYDGQTPTPPVPQPPPVETNLFVRVFSDLDSGLRLRSQPTTASDTLAIEPAGTALRVIEAEGPARAKIGVVNQWLRVRDPQGVEGYVAAWYVESAQPVPPAPEPEPEPEPEPPPVPAPDPQALIEAVNSLRVSKGLPPYKSSDILNGIAARHAAYMASSGQISHLDAAGKRPFQRALDAGYALAGDLNQGGFMSENIVAGVELSPQEAVTQWLADDPHTNTMLSDNYTEAGAGIAVAGNLTYYCLDAALPKTTVPTPEPEPEPEPEPQPEPGKPKVYVSPSVGSGGLAMRKEASETAREIARLSARAELTSLEGADSVQKKIGVNGKWLMVRDARGNSGYVPAWLLVLSLDGVPEPEPEPAQMTVIVFPSLGSGGLRMRAQPSLGGSLVTILPGGSELTVLEDPSTARPKLGVTNQWLNVRDRQGHTGYVAAWFVSEAPSGGDTPPVPPPQPEPSGLTIYVSPLAGNGLRLRSGPSTSSSTVKTLPANAPLTVLEPAAQAEAKIGAFNQWINVKDAAGAVGYVAAWYVNK